MCDWCYPIRWNVLSLANNIFCIYDSSQAFEKCFPSEAFQNKLMSIHKSWCIGSVLVIMLRYCTSSSIVHVNVDWEVNALFRNLIVPWVFPLCMFNSMVRWEKKKIDMLHDIWRTWVITDAKFDMLNLFKLWPFTHEGAGDQYIARALTSYSFIQ